MNPGTFVTLMIVGWLLLAAVTLWAFLRVPLRRARLQRTHHEQPAAAQPQLQLSSPPTKGRRRFIHGQLGHR
ncbi:MAG: hypothetical protein GAK43_02249 [Stenotrophomonas maltophilia]|nr:MAG: hypothetical protein GAK43_02249 [Stenotrophomonas maltophilia]